MENLLASINQPDDIKNFNNEQLNILCKEIRNFIIETTSKTGGHLASNLGVVELTVALHKIFNSPKDKFVWDVGHQCYTHKILTGRKDDFETLRQENGISGFTKPQESPHDIFISGHSSISISAAVGIANANQIKNVDDYTIAIIGDGALSGGEAYEGINNSHNVKNLIIVLNHNDMSISKNVGGFSKYLSNIRLKPRYLNLKVKIENFLDKTPIVGKKFKIVLQNSKSTLKRMLYANTFFEEMGFYYIGPINGHNTATLTQAFEKAKRIKNKPVLVHVDTRKGKGYEYAEQNPGAFHGTPKFNIETGNPDISHENSYSSVFGEYLTELANTNNKICAVTAAMKYGTGLQYFYKAHKDRFFDVGIAEQHAITFCAGLATNGMVPVFAVYSTFLQRAYDQLIHDVAIEKTHIVLGIDRAGIVGEDGETHQGIFDVSFVSNVPNAKIYSPSNYDELKLCLDNAIYKDKGLVAVRYPRGKQNEDFKFENINSKFNYLSESENNKILLVTYGRIFDNVYNAFKQLKEKGINCDILKLTQIHPLVEDTIDIAKNYEQIYFFEEGIKTGGIAEQFLNNIFSKGFRGKYNITAIDDIFIPQASVNSSLKRVYLDSESIFNTVFRSNCFE